LPRSAGPLPLRADRVSEAVIQPAVVRFNASHHGTSEMNSRMLASGFDSGKARSMQRVASWLLICALGHHTDFHGSSVPLRLDLRRLGRREDGPAASPGG
jgi:hypothetical protein